MKHSIIKAIVPLLLLSSELSAKSSLPQVAEAESMFSESNGQPVKIPSRGFAITPPTGWQYSLNFPNSTLLMQAPLDSNAENYRRTIQVTAFTESFYFTPDAVEQFGKSLVKKFSAGDSQIANFRIRSEQAITLENGDEGHLFYTEFAIDETPLMQMHVLISSSDRHFLITYTDLESHFTDNNKETPFLNEAWISINSTTLDSRPVSIFLYVQNGLIGIVALLILGFVFHMLRNRFSVQKYREYVEGTDTEELDATLRTQHSDMSGAMPESAHAETYHDKDFNVEHDDDDDHLDFKNVS